MRHVLKLIKSRKKKYVWIFEPQESRGILDPHGDTDNYVDPKGYITWSSLARATTSSKFALLSCYKDSNAKWLVLWEILKFYRKKQLNIIKRIRNNKNWKFSHLLLIPLIKLSKQQEFHPLLTQWSKRWLTSRVLPSGAMSLSWKHHQSTPSLFMNSKLAFTVICIKNFAGKKVHIISTVK